MVDPRFLSKEASTLEFEPKYIINTHKQGLEQGNVLHMSVILFRGGGLPATK